MVPDALLQLIPMLDLTRQFAPIRDEILTAIAHVCDTQNFILGPAVSQFESSSAALCGSPYAIGCASGTDALWLALAAAGVGETQPASVITSPFSFFATASAILRCGARPVFADIDPLTFNLCPDSVGALLKSPKPATVSAILPVHLYGQCADFDAFAALRQARPELVLIEDAAQAFGAEWRARPAGALGDAAAFSFYPTKNLSAFGDAGLVTTSDPELDRRARSLRAHGMTRRYYHDEVGANSRLDSIQAAILQVKLSHLPGWNQRRREVASLYDRLFRAAALVGSSTEDGIVLPYTDPRATHVFHQYVIRAPRRDALRQHLTGCGIGSEIYYPVPLHLQVALKHLGYKAGDLPHAERAAAEVLALPIFPELREEEQQAVVEAIRSFYA